MVLKQRLRLRVLSIALCIGPVACRQPRDNAAQVRPPSAVVQQRRDLSTPAKRLVGHWVNPSDSTDLYFGPTDTTTDTGILTQVESGSGGRVVKFHYTVFSQVPRGERVNLQLVTFTGSRRDANQFTVTRDGQRIAWRMTERGLSITDHLSYVDSQTAPR